MDLADHARGSLRNSGSISQKGRDNTRAIIDQIEHNQMHSAIGKNGRKTDTKQRGKYYELELTVILIYLVMLA